MGNNMGNYMDITPSVQHGGGGALRLRPDVLTEQPISFHFLSSSLVTVRTTEVHEGCGIKVIQTQRLFLVVFTLCFV